MTTNIQDYRKEKYAENKTSLSSLKFQLVGEKKLYERQTKTEKKQRTLERIKNLQKQRS